MSGLRELQIRFQEYLLGNSEAIEDDIVSTEDALAEHRLGTYYNAYRIRLIDCLAIDYSALDKHLGRESFEQVALHYLQLHPSTHPSVRWFGAQLPAFLRVHYHGEDAAFVCELAEYEWCQAMVFDSADSATHFSLEDMSEIAPEDWPLLGFEFKPAVRWLDLHYNVAQYKNALDQGIEAPPLQHGEHPQRWLLWRRDMKILWRSLEVDEAWAIEQAANGASFAVICEGLLEWIDAGQVALRAAGLLKQWIGDGLLVAVGKTR